MSNEIPVGIPTPSSNIPYIIREWELGDMQGKVLTILESIGLPEKQENAVKGLLRQAIWGTVNNGYRLILPGKLEEEVYRLNEQMGRTGPIEKLGRANKKSKS